MKSRKSLLIFLAILVSLGFFTWQAAAETFPIGAFWPMTGPQAYYGRVMSRGALTAIEQINAGGGVEKHNLDLIITDYKNVDVNLAVSGVRKMISVDKIPVVLASFSAPTLGVQPICARANVMMINGGASSPKLVNKPYLHNTRIPTHLTVQPMLSYLWKTGVRRLGVMYLSDPYGEIPAKDYIQPLWTKMGGTVIPMEPHQPGLTDFSAYLARIKSGNPDAIYDISTGQDTAYIVKGAREMGMNIPIAVADWSADYQAVAGKSSENVFVCVDFFDRESKLPETQKFVKDFETKWKEPTDFFSANYYDAIYNVIPELIRRVTKKGGSPLNGKELEEAIWSNPVFDTVYGGKMTFLKDGTVNKPMVIFKVINGNLTILERVSQ
jgi:branched-chain amino acid transport system substrate-binding protein